MRRNYRALLLPIAVLLSSLSLRTIVVAEEGNNNDDQAQQQQQNEEEMQEYDNQYKNNNDNNDAGDDIQYWTDYAVYPKRCIVYNNVDSIMFEMYNHDYCNDDKKIGTYVTAVPDFMTGWLAEKEQQAADNGNDDYAVPDVAQYVQCTAFEIQGVAYYMQLGCADDDTKAIAVNIYEDNACTVRSSRDGYDDANFDVSDLQPKFKSCQKCVNWINVEDADDQFYENRMATAPLCKYSWQYKSSCNRKCRMIGSKAEAEGWSSSDKLLLSVLTAFGIAMVGLIVRQRRKMSNKDAVLESARMNSIGLQPPHVIGIFVLILVVIAVCIFLGLKNVTWALVLIVIITLFGYLMKLTLDSAVSEGETIIGPDGNILRKDSDDSSMDSAPEMPPHQNNGTYQLPTLA